MPITFHEVDKEFDFDLSLVLLSKLKEKECKIRGKKVINVQLVSTNEVQIT